MADVFLLVSWDDRSDDVVAACSTLLLAQAAYLAECYPERGPRGGKREPPRQPITWHEHHAGEGHWTPSDHSPGAWSGWYIERHQVDSAAPRPPAGDSDGEAQPADP